MSAREIQDQNAIAREMVLQVKRQAPRIAFKANGSIVFLGLAEIVAVQAEGNYVSLRYRPSLYLVRESLSSMVFRHVRPAVAGDDGA